MNRCAPSRTSRALRAGTLAVGANEATCLYVLPDIFAEYSRRFPSVQISIYRNFSHKVLEKVEDGTVDVGIVTLAGEIAKPEGPFHLPRPLDADGRPGQSARGL